MLTTILFVIGCGIYILIGARFGVPAFRRAYNTFQDNRLGWVAGIVVGLIGTVTWPISFIALLVSTTINSISENMKAPELPDANG